LGKTTRLALGICLGLFGGCSSRSVLTGEEASQPPLACKKVEDFFTHDLARYQQRVDDAGFSYQDEQWKVETAAKEASLKKLAFHYEVLQKAIYNQSMVDQVNRLHEQVEKLDLKDCVWAGRLKRVKQVFQATILTDAAIVAKERENQEWQDRLQKESNGFRVTLPDESEPLSMALFSKKLSSTGDRTTREKLYKEFGSRRAKKWIEIGFRDLIKSRNEEAQLAGFKDYYAYRFSRNQLDLNGYWEIVTELKQKLAPKAHQVLKELGSQHGVPKVEPWDFRYLREQSASGGLNPWFSQLPESAAMDVARKFYAELGFNVDEYGFRTDLTPRPGKNTHAFAMALIFPHTDNEGQLLREPAADIRFLANLKKPVKWEDISTIIHELGHAIHAGEVRQPVAIFRGFDSVPTESIAMVLERFANTAQFLGDTLTEFAKVPSRDSASALKRHAKSARLEQALTLLRQVMFSEFERSMYTDPDSDYAGTWAKLAKEYWNIDVAPEYADWDIEHFLMAPVYVENYALGILTVEQAYDLLGGEYSSLSSKRLLGDRIRDTWFHPGSEFDYLTLVEKLTQKKLSAQAALKLLD